MIESILALALIVGQKEIGPGLIETQYLNQSNQIITIIEDND